MLNRVQSMEDGEATRSSMNVQRNAEEEREHKPDCVTNQNHNTEEPIASDLTRTRKNVTNKSVPLMEDGLNGLRMASARKHAEEA